MAYAPAVSNDDTKAELEIRNVLGRLAHLADAGDLDEYMSLFTDDAVWDHPKLGRREGKDDIHTGAKERRAAGQTSTFRSRHIITTQWVRVDDADHAVSQAYWILLDAADPPVVANTGRYDDTLRRTPDGWKLAERIIVLDVN